MEVILFFRSREAYAKEHHGSDLLLCNTIVLMQTDADADVASLLRCHKQIKSARDENSK